MADSRIRRNLFREVNEQIARVNAGFGVFDSHYSLLCECERSDCVERLDVPVPVWQELRRSEDRYVVADGHEDGAERVLASDAGYAVIRASGPELHLVDPGPAPSESSAITTPKPLPAA
jgi:hypothetical protein